MTGRSRIVLASGNAGKAREVEALLGGRYAIVLQRDCGVEPVPETGTTFAENALIKARHAARVSGLPALADDSGIEVDALDGAPGVYSARYAGPGASDADNVRKLLEALRDVPDDRRTARFRCVLAFVAGPDDPAPVLASGTWEGRIATVPAGGGGFGYDPVFIDSDSGRTGAELTAAEKNARSHRGQALRDLVRLLSGTD
jgi:XTP/dITP diphosphohydrolase